MSDYWNVYTFKVQINIQTKRDFEMDGKMKSQNQIAILL